MLDVSVVNPTILDNFALSIVDQSPGDTSAVLTWETNEPADTVIRYGTRPDRLDRVTSSSNEPVRFHHGRIRGLRPGTTYHYVGLSGAARLAIEPVEEG